MAIELSCRFSLSKKLRAIAGNNGSLQIILKNFNDGKGMGILRIDGNDVDENKVELGMETGIMMTPISVKDINNEEEVDNSESYREVDASRSFGTLFSQNTPVSTDRNTLVSKIAATDAKNVPYAVKSYDQIQKEAPPSIKIVNEVKKKSYIDNFDALKEAVQSALHKKSSIDLSKIDNIFKRAIAEEQMAIEEAIDHTAYVVNTTCASLNIQDMDYTLSLNMPQDLSRISAKRIANSKQFWSLAKEGLIQMVSPQKAQALVEQEIAKEERETLQCGKVEEVLDGLYADASRSNVQQLDVMDESDTMTEEEKLILQSGFSTVPIEQDISTLSGAPRRFHSGAQHASPSQASQPVSNNQNKVSTVPKMKRL